jgi:hypothetical protein
VQSLLTKKKSKVLGVNEKPNENKTKCIFGIVVISMKVFCVSLSIMLMTIQR